MMNLTPQQAANVSVRMSKCVHDQCSEVPHDIGISLFCELVLFGLVECHVERDSGMDDMDHNFPLPPAGWFADYKDGIR